MASSSFPHITCPRSADPEITRPRLFVAPSKEGRSIELLMNRFNRCIQKFNPGVASAAVLDDVSQCLSLRAWLCRE